MSYKVFLFSLFIYALTFYLSTVCVRKASNSILYKKWYHSLVVILPSIMAMFRHSGIDFKAYESIYNHISKGFTYDIEIGWIWLNRISPSYVILLFLSALIFFGASYIAICKVIDKHRDIAWFSFLISCHAAFFNGMRQMIAVALVFLALLYWREGKRFKFVILVTIGTLFHTTAVFMAVFAILYLAFVKRVNSKELITTVLSILFVMSLPILSFVSSQLGIYEGYFSKDAGSVSLGFLLYMVPPLLFYYYRKSIFSEDRLASFSLTLYLLVIPFQFLGMRIAYADRLMLYFQPFLCLLVPCIIENYLVNNKGKLRNIYIAWFMFQYLILNILLNSNGMYPYR